MKRFSARPGAVETRARDAGWLADAEPGDRLFVLSLRRWLDGPCGQAEVWNGFAESLGPGPASRLLNAFEGFLRDIAGALDRRLQRHATTCPCLGADEARLAAIVRSAGRGDPESARAIAAGIVREADLLLVIESAARLGQLMDNVGADPVCRTEAQSRLH